MNLLWDFLEYSLGELTSKICSSGCGFDDQIGMPEIAKQGYLGNCVWQ